VAAECHSRFGFGFQRKLAVAFDGGRKLPRQGHHGELDSTGACINVCGEVIRTTRLDDADSALEALCVTPLGDQRLQLVRQLTAAANSCTVTPPFESRCTLGLKSPGPEACP